MLTPIDRLLAECAVFAPKSAAYLTQEYLAQETPEDQSAVIARVNVFHDYMLHEHEEEEDHDSYSWTAPISAAR